MPPREPPRERAPSEPPGEPPETVLAERTWIGRSWILLAIIGIVLLVAGIGLGAVGRGTATVRVTTTVTVAVAAVPPGGVAASTGAAGPLTTFGDGSYQVGVEVPAGNYHTAGGHNCYWERLSNLSGGFTGIIANGQSTAPQTVRVHASDKAFSVRGGCEWALVP
jgi:hypothetical protein